MRKLLLALVFIPALLFSQSRKERKAVEAQQKADQQVINDFKSHIQNLTANKGGTSAEANEIEYISSQFKLVGLQPKGTNGFIQPFNVDDGKRIESSTYLKINDNLLQVHKEYFPLPYSAQKKVTGMPAMALRERGVPWFADVKDWLEDDSKKPESVEEVIKKEVTKVAGKGATALFLYNSGSLTDGVVFNKNDKSAALPIPVIYITADGYKKYFSDHSQMLDVDLNVAFSEHKLTGNNIIGYIDNGATNTVVMGAHYNHVSGADDNASGTAMLIELAKMLPSAKAKSNNYLFVASGGADKGWTAINYWLNNPTVAAPVNYMINLDMVGSYTDSKKLSVGGYNSSPVWRTVIIAIPDKKPEISINSIDETGDPSAAFYNKGIPVLSFSAAKHADYVNAADEEGKINYAGELQIAKFITRVVEATDAKGRLGFAETDQQNVTIVKPATVEAKPALPPKEAPVAVSRTTVSLGVIPDKTINGDGLKILGVTPKKLASKLGLQPGDVLTNLGPYKISDFKSYVQALAKFQPGDKTVLRIKRGKDDKEFAVEF